MICTTMSLFAGLSSINIGIIGPRFSITLCPDRSNRMASNQNTHYVYTSTYVRKVHTVYR